ncbi:hypothetical protein NQ317_003175 [Molorchus minor]|uniref:Uncharacterized protein n=1 Tax=Molorchus minor TaxID=1323400 RepID=A0ABQ9J9Y7_9CUCU|nr:hypothetical protein NQ317_003175 [Molorchus minor]
MATIHSDCLKFELSPRTLPNMEHINQSYQSTGSREFFRTGSARSAKRSTVLPKSSYSTPTSSSAPRSPSLSYHGVDPPRSLPATPKSETIAIKSPKVSLSSPSQTERAMFDFNQCGPRSPSAKSPRSPRKFTYDGDARETTSSECDSFSFNLASPPKKASKMYNRKVYQSSRSDSFNSTKSSLEYSSTIKHPTGAYQDIEYKVCHSLDSDSQTNSSYRYSVTSTSSRHSSLREKSRPKCNIRTNPGYDEKYGSSKRFSGLQHSDPQANVIGNNFIFMQDKAVTDYLGDQNIDKMDWPASSPDMNPIEHVGDQLGRRLLKRPNCLVTTGEFGTVVNRTIF